MKGISCNSNFLADKPVEQAIDKLAEHGYDAIDICLELAPPFHPIPTPHMHPDDSAAKRKQVRQAAESAGVAIAAMNAHTNLCARDPETRQANKEFVAKSIILGAELGAEVVVTVAGGKDAYGYEQWFWEWSIEILRELLPLADQHGMKLAIEAGSPPGCLVYNLETMQRLLATDGCESIGALFDPAHYHIRGDKVNEVVQALGKKIVHMHAKDATGNPENIVFPPLGQGEIDFDALLGALSAEGFEGYIAMEYEAFAWNFSKDQDAVLSSSKAFLDALVKKHWS
ncbi:MAG: sugar phosphate isomerase/epimerase [Pirellulaceae bacterium]|nr:sugar phosphate isomerase/epimerase [Pirellulaceae bacterium]